MAIKKSVFIAASLDGFIAREDGSIEWLLGIDNPDGDDFGYNEFIKDIDVIIMGRNTFEIVKSFDKWQYGKIKVIVITSSKYILPEGFNQNVEITNDNPHRLIERLESEGYKHAYVDGGKTIQSFLREGLIDEITITTIPVILGSGIPLLGSIGKQINMTHIKTNVYKNGFVQNSFLCK
ncbi:MAG: dihydrofolate reductase family protein [Melioribacteraceae bacterium]